MITPPAKRQRIERHTRFEGGSQELVPGILDDITLLHIVPRLSWKVVSILSSVSRAFHHAIRTRQVYDARVVSHSTETFVVASFSLYGASNPTLSSLYSRVREDPIDSERDEIQIRPASVSEDPIESECNDIQIRPAFRRLPPTPCDGDQWICSDGYIYYLGVAKNSYGQRCSSKVFVFDVAGQRAWKVCASMNERRRDFAFSAVHGKLYVFGGLTWNVGPGNHSPSEFCGCEVYHPKEDRWSPIKPMPTLRFGHRVDIVGDEFFVHGGNYFGQDHYHTAREAKGDDQNASNLKHDDHSSDDEDDSSDDDDSSYIYKDDPWVGVAKFAEFYHPVKDEWREWRVVNPFGRVVGNNSIVPLKSSMHYLFAVEGKLYSINWSSIHVYGAENSWTPLHSFSFPIKTNIPTDSVRGKVTTAVVFDGKLFVKAVWWSIDRRITASGQFETEEFCGESKEIIWEESPYCFTRHKNYPTSSTQLIQL